MKNNLKFSSKKIQLLTDKVLEDSEAKSKQIEDIGKKLNTLSDKHSSITQEIKELKTQFNDDSLSMSDSKVEEEEEQ